MPDLDFEPTPTRTLELEAADSQVTGRFTRFEGEALDANLALVAEIEKIAVGKGVTPGQLALAWVLAQGEHHDAGVAPIPGTKRVKYLEENVGAAAIALSVDDRAALETAVPRDAVTGDRYADMSTVGA